MIKIYISPTCSSCRKVIKWFKEKNIPFIEKNIFVATLKEEELKDILFKSENGTDDIISKKSKIIKENKLDIDNMSLNEIINFIKMNPSVLKRPIIVDDRKIQVGYNQEEISAFIPHAQRLAEWACTHEDCPHFKNCSKINEKES